MIRRAFLAGLAALALAGLLGRTAEGQGLRVGQAAPEIIGGPWINSPLLTMSRPRGRVVLVEFWTYG